jgi:hypothetical protein
LTQGIIALYGHTLSLQGSFLGLESLLHFLTVLGGEQKMSSRAEVLGNGTIVGGAEALTKIATAAPDLSRLDVMRSHRYPRAARR